MKKEVINFTITTMVQLYEVEMQEKGKFSFQNLDNEQKQISVSQDKIEKFWQQVDSIDVWNWKRKYEHAGQ